MEKHPNTAANWA